MTNVTAIARHELRLLRSTGVVSIMAVFIIALTVVAAVLGASRVAQANEDAFLLQMLERAPLAVATGDIVANERGTFASLPLAPLLALSGEQDGRAATHVRITARLRGGEVTAERVDRPLARLTGSFDLTFIVLYLYPLFLLGISFDLTASEKAAGTLRLLLVQGASLRDIVLGKVAARALLAAALPLFAGMACVAVAGPTDGVRLTLWIVTALAYGVFWLSLAVLINARGKSATANAVSLAGLWLMFLLVIPPLLGLMIHLQHPTPSSVAAAVATREATQAAVVQGSRLLGRFLEDHPAGGTGVDGLQQYFLLQNVREQAVQQHLEPLLHARDAQQSAQARAVARWQFLSPLLLTRHALAESAGTSVHRERRLAEQVGVFQREWKAHFTPEILASPLDLARADELPRFVFREESRVDVARRVLLPLTMMLTVAFVSFVAALRAYNRSSVTGV